MKKYLITLLLLIITITIGYFIVSKLFFSRSSQPKPIIKIGVSLPLTGNLANIGTSSQKALTMAFEKLNLKNTKYSYELIIKDDASNPKKTAANTNKLLTVNNVRAMLSVSSNSANVISPIAQRNNILHLTCANSPQSAEGFYNFNNITMPEPQAQLMLNTLKDKDIKSIVMLISDNPDSILQSEILEEKIKNDGTIKILSKEVYTSDSPNFKDVIQNTDPDIFYIDGTPPDANLAAQYLKDKSGIINLTSINDFVETFDREIFEDLWFIESASGTADFIGEYEHKNQHLPFLCSSNSYDNLNALIWSYENTPAKEGYPLPHNEDVAKTLLSITDWQGANGGFFVDQNGVFQTQPSVKIIQNGRTVSDEE